MSKICKLAKSSALRSYTYNKSKLKESGISVVSFHQSQDALAGGPFAGRC